MSHAVTNRDSRSWLGATVIVLAFEVVKPLLPFPNVLVAKMVAEAGVRSQLEGH